MNQLDRIEDKLDSLTEKLHNHIKHSSVRIAKAETSINYIKWGLSVLLVTTSTVAIALAKFIS